MLGIEVRPVWRRKNAKPLDEEVPTENPMIENVTIAELAIERLAIKAIVGAVIISASTIGIATIGTLITTAFKHHLDNK